MSSKNLIQVVFKGGVNIWCNKVRKFLGGNKYVLYVDNFSVAFITQDQLSRAILRTPDERETFHSLVDLVKKLAQMKWDERNKK